MGIINKTKDFIKKIGIKKFTVIIVLLIVVIFSFIKLVSYLTSDRMNNAGIAKVKYRVYTKEHGWSKWCKNGTTCGNGKDDILNIEVKSSDVIQDYQFYSNNKWLEKKKSNKGKIYGIRFTNSYEFSIKHSTCYRTYNKKNKWLGWACNNGLISGNIDEPITAIEIKAIPNSVVYTDYLKDYYENNNSYNFGF